MDLSQLLFNFSGRINRAKYWIAAAIYFAVIVIAVLLFFVFGFGALYYVVVVVLYIAILISGIAVGIKRLHDRDKSAWWLLLFYVVPGVLGGIGMAAGGWHWLFDVPSWAISLWALIEFGFLRGTSGANQYGPDPLAPR
jgi:uncharacterized membrane protein YhaH (DUF805 family)